jgi:hypothetical protein
LPPNANDDVTEKMEGFLTQFYEHLQAFRKNNFNSDISKHLLQNQHPFRTTDIYHRNLIHNSKTLISQQNAKYYMFEEAKNNQRNYQNTFKHNAISRALYQPDQ